MKDPAINPYIAMVDDFRPFVSFAEESFEASKAWGEIRKSDQQLHVEVGTGAGFHFTHYAKRDPNSFLVGFEIKYKELIQTIRRARGENVENVHMVKGDASDWLKIFDAGEISKVLINFPDPWPKRRHRKNRLMTTSFFEDVYKSTSEDGVLEIKTDHAEYFRFALNSLQKTSWKLLHYTDHLHQSKFDKDLLRTQFEKIFERKNHPVCFGRWVKIV